MNIILFGAPTSGKGTQSQFLMQDRNMVHISTGDMLREAIALGTALGEAAQSIMANGGLVSDDIILGIISDKISSLEVKDNLIFDGFPRTLKQAEGLNALFLECGVKLDCVIELKVDADFLIGRLQKRIDSTPVKERRVDDNIDTFRKRLDVYAKETTPILDYYRQRSLLHTVDGSQSIEQVKKSIELILS